MLSVRWKGGMAFEAQVPSGNNFVMDAHPEFGGDGLGPTPVEALLSSAAACSAMDVVGILEKKRQVITGYRIEVEWQRAPEGKYPRPILSMIIRHVLEGENLDASAVQKAVELSDQKYCSVVATLRQAPSVVSEFRIDTNKSG
jgi:putative redox protein